MTRQQNHGAPGPERTPFNKIRRAAIRREVAAVAAQLFVENGYAATTVDDIAAAAGMGLRTFYRYFSGKEDVVAPLLAIGTQAWADQLAACAPEVPLREALSRSYRSATAEAGTARRHLYPLLRAATEHPALRATWLRVQQDCEGSLIPIIAARTGRSADDLDVALVAAMANAAARVGTERWVAEAGLGSAADAVDTCLAHLAAHTLL